MVVQKKIIPASVSPRALRSPQIKIIDNIFVLPNVGANTSIIVDTGGFTVIDAGLPRSEKKILPISPV